MDDPSCPGTFSVDQTGLELRDLPASAFWLTKWILHNVTAHKLLITDGLEKSPYHE